MAKRIYRQKEREGGGNREVPGEADATREGMGEEVYIE